MDREAWRATGSQRVQHNLVTNSSTGYYMQLACRCFSSLLTGALSTVFCPSCCSTWQGQPLGDGGIHRRSCARDSHLCPPATPTFRASPSGGDWKNHSHLFILSHKKALQHLASRPCIPIFNYLSQSLNNIMHF